MSQLQLFQHDERRGPSRPDVNQVRTRLQAVLQELRAADALPWSTNELRDWRYFVPQMSNWLPPEEAAKVREEFSAHLERLCA